jgi:hypothetical protein
MVAPFGYVHRSASRMSLSDGRGKLRWMRRYRPVVTGCLCDSVGAYGERERRHPEDSRMGGGVAASRPGPAAGGSNPIDARVAAPLLGDLLPKVRAGGYPAGIVLPATTFWESNDVHTPWAGAGHCAIYLK